MLFANKIIGVNFPQQVTGLVGMGYTNPQTQPNFLDIAYQNQQIQTSMFSLQLKNSLLYPVEQSYLYFDKIPLDILNNTVFTPVFNKSNGYWQTHLIGVYAD